MILLFLETNLIMTMMIQKMKFIQAMEAVLFMLVFMLELMDIQLQLPRIKFRPPIR